MADFKFNIEDMFDPDKMMSSAVGEISKHIPKEVTNLSTSRHKSKTGDPRNVTMFNLAEILMRAPAFDSVENVLSRFEAIVSGTAGSIYDEIEDLPGGGAVLNLLPKDIRVQLDRLNPDGGGEEKATPDWSGGEGGDWSQGRPEGANPAKGSLPTPLGPDPSSGLSVECRAIKKYILDAGIPHRITSTSRPGAKTAGSGKASNHSKSGTGGASLAADIAGLTPSKIITPNMRAIFEAFYIVKDQLQELIYSDPEIGHRNIYAGKHHKYTGVTWDNHKDHVHVGVRPGTFLIWPGLPGESTAPSAPSRAE